jgi:glycosyltransferase involved in cell wall biosynthesis
MTGAQRLIRTRDVLSSRLNWRRGHLEAIQGHRQVAAKSSSALEFIVPPDLALVGWLPFALPRALRLARRELFDCVITTSPPQSAHLIGAALRRTGLPWIADLRDGWTYDPPRGPWPTAAQAAADRALEVATLVRADRVVAVTAPIAADLAVRLDREVAVITNGFDPEEVSGHSVPPSGMVTTNRHTLVHTGRAGVAGRSPRTFLEGVIELRTRHPDIAGQLEIVFAGATTEDERSLLGDERLGGIARTVGMLERPRALALQRGADSLLVLADGASAHSVATNKLFEYLAARRPILVLGDGSEAARIVRESRSGVAVPANDPLAIATALRSLVADEVRVDGTDLDRFSWPVLAEQFEREIELSVRDPS